MTISEERKRIHIKCLPKKLEISNGGARSEGIKVNNFMEIQILFEEPVTDETLLLCVPWGEDEQDFTNTVWGQAITVSAFEGWSVNEVDNKAWGRHWVLNTKGNPVKRARARFENINLLCRGITCINVYHRWGESGQHLYRIPLLKESQTLRIEKFQAEDTTVKRGQGVKLSWIVTGGENCTLDPGNMVVPPAGERIIYTDSVREFTLRANQGKHHVSGRLQIFYTD